MTIFFLYRDVGNLQVLITFMHNNKLFQQKRYLNPTKQKQKAPTKNPPESVWEQKLGKLLHHLDSDSLMSRMFANGPGDRGLIPGLVIPKTLKMVLDATLLNTQHYKVRIKGKVV